MQQPQSKGEITLKKPYPSPSRGRVSGRMIPGSYPNAVYFVGVTAGVGAGAGTLPSTVSTERPFGFFAKWQRSQFTCHCTLWERTGAVIVFPVALSRLLTSVIHIGFSLAVGSGPTILALASWQAMQVTLVAWAALVPFMWVFRVSTPGWQSRQPFGLRECGSWHSVHWSGRLVCGQAPA